MFYSEFNFLRIPGSSSGGILRIQTASGMGGQAFTGGTIQVAGTNTQVGVTVQLIPNFVSSSIKLTFAVASTEIGASSGQAEAVRTNLQVACRVLLPNAGGLVVEGGNAGAADGKNHWLIVCPTAVDSRGNPIKP